MYYFLAADSLKNKKYNDDQIQNHSSTLEHLRALDNRIPRDIDE